MQADAECGGVGLNKVATVLRAALDILLAVVLFKVYRWSAVFGANVMHVDFWFTRVTFGIIGAGLAFTVFNIVKTFVFYVLKCCSIGWYSGDCKGTWYQPICTRFGSVLTVPVFNVVIRHALKEFVAAFRDALDANRAAEGDRNVTGLVYGVVNRLDGSLVSRLGKLGSKMLSRIFNYADECVLGFCFRHTEMDLATATIASFKLLFANLNQLLPKMFMWSVLEVALRWTGIALAAVVLFAVFGIPSGVANVASYVIDCYVILQLTARVIEDAILEPMIMCSVLREFFEFDGNNEAENEDSLTEFKEKLFEAMPALEGITRFSGFTQDNTKEND